MDALLDVPLAALVWYVGLLDRVPDFARAMLTGLLLVGLLKLSRRQVPARDVQFSISFWKISLLALVVVPLLVWLVPESRLTVLVDRLEPVRPSAGMAWLTVLGVWGGGTLFGLARLARAHGRTRAALRALPPLPDDHQLSQRLQHWRHRLGASPSIRPALSEATGLTHVTGTRRVVLPQAVAHWPRAPSDLLVIQGLCRDRKHQGGWTLFAQAVACCYWPLPWVRTAGLGLQRDFHLATDNLAAACYQDDLGYHRALRQIQQRLKVPGDTHARASCPSAARSRLAAAACAYRAHLRATLVSPQPARWDAEVLSEANAERREAVWSEPGEQLALLIGRTLLVALLVSSVTLREVPPEIERDYSITLDPTWMNTAFPDPNRFSTLPAGRSGPAPAPSQEP